MKTLETALVGVPRVHLASLPTPLERLERTEAAWGHPGIYIKRDDLTGLGPGGNKLRSLEFLAGHALQEGKDTLIAAGPVQSNLCTLTAAACAKLGMACALVHNGDRPARLEGNLLLNHLLGAESYYLGEATAEERSEFVERLAKEMEEGKEQKAASGCTISDGVLPVGKHPYIIRNGATTGRGALGYVNAVPELARQFAFSDEKPTIFAPGGNGGVASGLIYGNAAQGFPFRIVVLSVEDDRETMEANIRRTIGEIEEILELPMGCSLEDACVLDDSYRGGGWGEATKESVRMVEEFPRREGIMIENVYNSKVLVGMEDYIRRGLAAGPVCYLHTGGFGSLFAQF